MKSGDTITDNDPRTPRSGTIVRVLAKSVTVKWRSGRQTSIDLARVHTDGKTRRTGYSWKKKAAE